MADDDKRSGRGHPSGKPPYEVGYGKPPVEHQFGPGQSGNSAGRPKKPRSLRQLIADVAKEPVEVTEPNGERRSMSKVELLIRRLMNDAAKGDRHARRELLRYLDQIHGVDEREATEAEMIEDLTPEELALIRELSEELAQYKPKPPGRGAPR